MFTVKFTIAPDMPIYNQYQAVYFARCAVTLEKNRPWDEAKFIGIKRYESHFVINIIPITSLLFYRSVLFN